MTNDTPDIILSISPETISSFEPLSGVRDIQQEIEWYLSGYETSKNVPRVKEITEAIVGKKEIYTALEQIGPVFKEKNPSGEYREIIERAIRLLVTLNEHRRKHRKYTAKTPPTNNQLHIAQYRVSQRTTLIVYEKKLFTQSFPTTRYGVVAPRDIGKELKELTKGFSANNHMTERKTSPQPSLTIETGTVPKKTNSVEERLKPRNITKHPDKVASRIESAASLDGKVYPLSPGMYEIQSDSGNAHQIDLASLIAGNQNPICMCEDFQYFCSDLRIDCKHILLLKNLIHHGYLPPVYENNSEEWMKAKISDLQDELQSNIKTGTTNGPDIAAEANERIQDGFNTPMVTDLRKIDEIVTEAIEECSNKSDT